MEALKLGHETEGCVLLSEGTVPESLSERHQSQNQVKTTQSHSPLHVAAAEAGGKGVYGGGLGHPVPVPASLWNLGEDISP